MSVGCQGGEIDYKLTVDTTKVLRDIQILNTVFNRTISILRKMGLPENIMQAITFIQRMIALLNQLRLTMLALQAASGPYGWTMALLSLAGTQLTAADMSLEVHSH